MKSTPIRRIWLVVHLCLGLAWVAVLSAVARHDSPMALAPQQVAQMLGVAGWMPTIATACWQVNRRQWLALLSSDLIASVLLAAVASTVYVPLFLFNVVWFLPFALLPRGCVTEFVVRTAKFC